MLLVTRGAFPQQFTKYYYRELFYHSSYCISIDLRKNNDRYNLLNGSLDINELNKNWKLLHKPYQYPLFSDYCKYLQMLSQFKNFSEISIVYQQLLNHISHPPQNSQKWRKFDASNHPMNVTQIMRCAKIANDWNTMYQFLQIYIENAWKFNKISAGFALECCWRYDTDDDMEDTVISIWNNLITNNIPHRHCFIQLLHCLDKKFVNKDKIKLLLTQILTELSKYPNNDKNKIYLDMIIYNLILDICHKYNFNDITNQISQQILPSPESNIFLKFASIDDHVNNVYYNIFIC